MKISAVILAKNEQNNITRCLRSLDFCGEIIVVDDYSEDKTIEKVRSYKLGVKQVKVFKRKLNGDFAGQRNSGLEKAKYEWVLFVDADETISDELKSEIELKIKNQKLKIKEAAFFLKRRDFFWDKELSWGETKKIIDIGLIRLVKKDSGKWEGKVHEEFKIQNSKFKIESLKNYLNHYPHQSVKEFLNEVNFYSSLRAKELLARGKSVSIFEIILYPFAKFLVTYFLKLGFLDGPGGFVYAFFMSFHSFLVRAKLYQYKKL